MRFGHVSTDNILITRDNFREPEFNSNWRNSHNPPDGSLFLSLATETGTEWQDRAQQGSAREKLGTWVNGIITYFDIDFERHNIFVVDTVPKLIDFMFSNSEQRENTYLFRAEKAMIKDIETIIANILDHIDQIATDGDMIYENEIIIKEMEKITEIYPIKDYKIVYSKRRGINLNHIAKVYCTLRHYYEELGNLTRKLHEKETEVIKEDYYEGSIILENMDYSKVFNNYNGIWFSSKLWTNNSKKRLCKLSDKVILEFLRWNHVGFLAIWRWCFHN